LEKHGCLTAKITKIGVFSSIYIAGTKTVLLKKIEFDYHDISSQYYSFSGLTRICNC